VALFNVGSGKDVINLASGANFISISDEAAEATGITVNGSGGVDTVTFTSVVGSGTASGAAAQIVLGAGVDVINLNGSGTNNIFVTDTDGVSINGSAGVDNIILKNGASGVATIDGGALIDTIDLGTTGGIAHVKVSSALAVDGDVIANFVTGEDKLDLSPIMAPATLTVGSQINAAGAANQGAGAALIQTEAHTDAPVYYILNTAAAAGIQTLAEIETAITAGTGATGEGLVIVENATATYIYYDAAFETDAGAGAGLILVGTLTGVTVTVTADLLSV
jgi:hypothetical protein